MDWSEYLRPGFWESLVNKNDKRYAIKMINDIRFMEVDKSLRNIEINLNLVIKLKVSLLEIRAC